MARGSRLNRAQSRTERESTPSEERTSAADVVVVTSADRIHLFQPRTMTGRIASMSPSARTRTCSSHGSR